ncbi:MAG: carboxylating nicotinate-nucleotide diphosphorylase [Gammaproteobacteria bacterium]|nr:carboxylating nicotinate-nucleotide diphosphorylase [Gammaproteobacteria bacterium]
MITPPDPKYIEETVKSALQEDLGSHSGVDITAELIPADKKASATLISREKMIMCGALWAEEVFKQLKGEVNLQWMVNEGDEVAADSPILKMEGNARAILIGERTLMNFVQTLSGTATITHHYVAELSRTACRLLDTRKTIPGLRLAQKYAVTIGGGLNHRIGLFDAFLIKENHIAVAGGIENAVRQARANHPAVKLEVEVENLDELRQALNASADVIMLDNFTIAEMKKAVEINEAHKSKAELEASGDVTLSNLAEIANTGVDYISVGALTKHVRAVDLSMRVNLD